MIATVMAGFFGTVSFISIIANIRFERNNNKLRKENIQLQTQLEKEISKNLFPIR